MKGAVLYGPGDIRFEHRDDPKIVEPTDAILRPSALARNDPTLLAKNDQHHTELVTFLPAGKTAFSPHGESPASQGPGASALECLGRLGAFFAGNRTP
jgi:hypothetical protein